MVSASTLADVLRYSPAAQFAFDNFDVPSLQKLDPSNRWVLMADIVPHAGMGPRGPAPE